MAFSTNQVRALKRELKASDIRTRQAQGRELSYIEGWHAIAEANRIFGYDAWSRETVESRCVLSRENRGTLHVVYVAKVRLSVRAKDQVIVREGFGTGEAQCPTLGEAHDKAIKTAETDATKRALATFGKPFGLALYLGHRSRVQQQAGDAPKPDIARRRTLQRLGPNGRYYVPHNPVPPMDPDLVAHNAAATAQTVAVDGQEDTDQHQARSDSPLPEAVAAITTTSPEPAPSPGGPTSPEPAATDPGMQQRPSLVENARSGITELLLPRTPRRRVPAHLKYVAAQPCLLCGRTPSDAHHLRFAQPRALGRKVSDEFAVPLCRTHHRQLHQGGNEVQWWMDMDIDPLPIARDLWEESRGKVAATASSAVTPLATKG